MDSASYETCLLARIVGFNEPCTVTWLKRSNGVYRYKPRPNETDNFCGFSTNRDNWYGFKWPLGDDCTAPTKAELQKWLRDKHNMHIAIQVGLGQTSWWSFQIINIATNNYVYDVMASYDSYEDALEAGLVQGLKIIEEENVDSNTSNGIIQSENP